KPVRRNIHHYGNDDRDDQNAGAVKVPGNGPAQANNQTQKDKHERPCLADIFVLVSVECCHSDEVKEVLGAISHQPDEADIANFQQKICGDPWTSFTKLKLYCDRLAGCGVGCIQLEVLHRLEME